MHSCTHAPPLISIIMYRPALIHVHVGVPLMHCNGYIEVKRGGKNMNALSLVPGLYIYMHAACHACMRAYNACCIYACRCETVPCSTAPYVNFPFKRCTELSLSATQMSCIDPARSFSRNPLPCVENIRPFSGSETICQLTTV